MDLSKDDQALDEIYMQLADDASSIFLTQKVWQCSFSDQGPMTKENSHKKTWKGKVAKQWKRMQGSTSTTGNSAYPEGGSIGNNHIIFSVFKKDTTITTCIKTTTQMYDGASRDNATHILIHSTQTIMQTDLFQFFKTQGIYSHYTL